MALVYRALQSTFESKDGEKKWFPCLVKIGSTADTQELARTIARESTLTEGDVHNVIRQLAEVMKKELLNSRSVRFDGLGTFTVIARAGKQKKGVSTYEEVNHTQIHKLSVRFTPAYNYNHIDGTTRGMFTGVTFERIDNRFTRKSVDPADPTPGVFNVASVTLNGTTVAKGSGILIVTPGDVLEIKGTGLNGVELKVRALINPTGSPYDAPLTALGTVAVSSATLIRVNVALDTEAYHLLRVDTSAVVYSFQ